MSHLSRLSLLWVIALMGCGTSSQKTKPKTENPPVEVPPSRLAPDAAPRSDTVTSIATSPQTDLAPDDGTATTPSEGEPDLPTAVIVRLPVDANGAEDTSRIEMRLDRSGQLASDQDGVISRWEQAEIVDKVKSSDEMDHDSSQASWFYHPVGYGGWPWVSPWYRMGYGYRYWPSYGHWGHNYYYNTFPHYYNHWGYHYYYYPRPWGWW